MTEQITLYDKNDLLLDTMTLPEGYMDGEPVRSVIWGGRKFVEGGRPDSYYGKGQFAEVVD